MEYVNDFDVQILMEKFEKYNKSVNEAKLGFRLMFPEPLGTEVHVFGTYNGNDKNKHRNNVCIKNLCNINNPGRYEDLDENGKPVNHMWIENVLNPQNIQSKLWESLIIGDTVIFIGILYEYKSHNILKLGIQRPLILQVFRNNQEIYRNHQFFNCQ